MVYQARRWGASAILLICSILEDEQLKSYLQLAQELGLSALVEAHTEQETERAQKAGARIIGVNNRNLKDFRVDLQNSLRLRRMVPRSILFVSEWGSYTGGRRGPAGKWNRRGADRRSADARCG